MDKIVFTGGSGTLGTEIQCLANNNILFPSSKEFNILNFNQCDEYIKNNNIRRIIHSAAYTNVKEAEVNYIQTIETNILGTINMIKLCDKYSLKLVYISTDYVFDGDKGNYLTTDPINPLSKYAKSKASAELAVRMYDNSLVIRTSFFGYTFPYDKAFTDQWTTKDYIDLIAPKILQACLLDECGIKHVMSNKTTIYELAIKRNINVQKIQRKDIKNISIPKDTSLI